MEYNRPYTEEELKQMEENVKNGIGLPPLKPGERRFPALPDGHCGTSNTLVWHDDKPPRGLEFFE